MAQVCYASAAQPSSDEPEAASTVVTTQQAGEPDTAESSPSSTFGDTAARIFDAIAGNKVIAFVEFTDSSGKVSKFSQAIFQEVEPVMINKGIKRDLTFIERKDLKLLMDEWDLNSIAGGDTGAQILLGADYIMTGKARLSSSDVICVLKLIDLEDGSIAGMVKARLEAEPVFYEWENARPAKKKIETKGAATPPQEVADGPNRASSPDGKLTVWTTRDSYRIGEKFQIFFEVTEPLYVELINVTTEGRITTIFPNPDQMDNYCVPGKTYTIPPPNGSFDVIVTPPAGFDRIKALASSFPFKSSMPLNTRGIAFTKSVVDRADIRTTLSFEIE